MKDLCAVCLHRNQPSFLESLNFLNLSVCATYLADTFKRFLSMMSFLTISLTLSTILTPYNLQQQRLLSVKEKEKIT